MEFPCCVELFLFSFGENPHQISDIAAISAANQEDSGKSLKIKFKPFRELEKGTPHKDVASLFGETKNTLSAWKKKQNLPIVLKRYWA